RLSVSLELRDIAVADARVSSGIPEKSDRGLIGNRRQFRKARQISSGLILIEHVPSMLAGNVTLDDAVLRSDPVLQFLPAVAELVDSLVRESFINLLEVHWKRINLAMEVFEPIGYLAAAQVQELIEFTETAVIVKQDRGQRKAPALDVILEGQRIGFDAYFLDLGASEFAAGESIEAKSSGDHAIASLDLKAGTMLVGSQFRSVENHQ